MTGPLGQYLPPSLLLVASSRHRSLCTPWSTAVLGVVASLAAVVAHVVSPWWSQCAWSGKLEWSTVGRELWPSPTVLLLWWTVTPPGLLRPGGVPLLLLGRAISHPLALRGSLLRSNRKPLPPLVLTGLTETVLHVDGGIDEVSEAVVATPQVSS